MSGFNESKKIDYFYIITEKSANLKTSSYSPFPITFTYDILNL